MKFLKKVDPEIYELVKREEKRQQETLMMIPSENLSSQAVFEAVGSCLSEKYAEGYPGRRYYQGNQVVDVLETLVIERVKKAFGVPEANVQPHSGSPANFAVYTALLNPGDTLMGLTLTSGGHLTHGAARSASSIYFNSVQYDVGKDGFMDYVALRKQVKQVKPKLIISGLTAYPRLIDWEKFADIAAEVDAFLMADISHIAGLVLAGVYPSPVQHVHVVTTTTHKTIRGPRGALIMVTDKGLKRDPDMAKKINSAIIPGIQGGPHMNAIAGIGVALKEDQKPAFKTYAKQVIKNAQVLAKELMKYDFDLVSGGTDSHLLLVDVRNKNLLGNTAAEACDAANIILNRNGIPFDPNPPFYPSGIRLGTPGLTSRGMKEPEMKLVAKYINDSINAVRITKEKMGITIEAEKKKSLRTEIIENTSELKKIRSLVIALCKRFPIKKEY